MLRQKAILFGLEPRRASSGLSDLGSSQSLQLVFVFLIIGILTACSTHHDQRAFTLTTTPSQALVYGIRSVVDKRQYDNVDIRQGLLEGRNLEDWLPSALIRLSQGVLKIIPYESSGQDLDRIIDVEILKVCLRRTDTTDAITLALRVIVKDGGKVILDKIYREEDKAINWFRLKVNAEHINTGLNNALKKIVTDLQRDFSEL